MRYLETFENRSHARLGYLSNKIQDQQDKVRRLAEVFKKTYPTEKMVESEEEITSGLSSIGLRFNSGANIVIRRRSDVLEITIQPYNETLYDLVAFFNSLGYFKRIVPVNEDYWVDYYLNYGKVDRLINDIETNFDKAKFLKMYLTKKRSKQFDL